MLVLWGPWRKTSPPASLRLSVELGGDISLTTGQNAAVALSPNGQMVAFTAPKAGGALQLYIRRLDQLEELVAVPLPARTAPPVPFSHLMASGSSSALAAR